MRKPTNDKAPVKNSGPRVNEQIRAPQVRVIDQDGEMLGVMSTNDAIAKAKEAKLDLIEVSPNAEPPVAKILDFGKYKFQEQKKLAVAKKKQKTIEIKEIKVRPGIEEHDYQVKFRALQRFIEEGNKVKVTLRFRGREIAHQEIALEVMNRFKQDMGESIKVETQPKMEGRQMLMILSPTA